MAAILIAAQVQAAPPSPGRQAEVDPWDGAITEASRRFDLPEQWIREVIRAESAGQAWRDGAPLISRAGAIGLMQVMPATYAAMARVYGLGPDPANPRDNILAGTAYLRLMYNRFGSPGFLAAYNAGPGRYADHLATGRPLPGETRIYLATISARLRVNAGQLPIEVASAPADGLFTTARPTSDQLFFALRSSAPTEERASK